MQVKFVNASEDSWFTYYGLDPASNKPLHVDATGKAVPNVPSAMPTDALAIKVTSALFDLPMLSAGRLGAVAFHPQGRSVDRRD